MTASKNTTVLLSDSLIDVCMSVYVFVYDCVSVVLIIELCGFLCELRNIGTPMVKIKIRPNMVTILVHVYVGRCLTS